MEELLLKHKKELKELQNETIRLKKSVQKSDKKRVKENQATITNLEKELKERHQKEIEEIKLQDSKDDDNELVIESSQIQNINISTSNDAPKLNKKKKKKQDKDQKISNLLRNFDANTEGSERTIELKTIINKLIGMNMKLIEIPADGNCLYNAIGYQCMKTKLFSSSCDFGKSDEVAIHLRKLAANEMLKNSDSYSPFVDNDEMDFEKYCDNIRSTRIWGGHIEIKALSSALKRPIKILQANTEPIIVQGDEIHSSESPLLIVYHRFELGLGEHYNTCDYITDPNFTNGDGATNSSSPITVDS